MPLSILVCLKSVPKADSGPAVLDLKTKMINRAQVENVINALDKHALSSALSLKAQHGGTVGVISMAPESARLNLLEALAMGADAAYLLSDKAFAGSDTLATSYVLAHGIRKIGGWDLILAGAYSEDGGTAQVPAQLAEWLDVPHVHYARGIRYEDEHFLAATACRQGIAHWCLPKPALISVERKINQPVPATFRGIRQAKTKPFTVWSLADLPGCQEFVGLSGSPTQFGEMRPFISDRRGALVRGDNETLCRHLLAQLAQAGVNPNKGG